MIEVEVKFTNKEGKEETAKGRILLWRYDDGLDGEELSSFIVLNDSRIVMLVNKESEDEDEDDVETYISFIEITQSIYNPGHESIFGISQFPEQIKRIEQQK